ncbi:MAG: hypothetical protein K2I06_07265 [Ruminococcus sp.]|nr:hypothetical protein [Ruminococcus sp.]
MISEKIEIIISKVIDEKTELISKMLDERMEIIINKAMDKKFRTFSRTAERNSKKIII